MRAWLVMLAAITAGACGDDGGPGAIDGPPGAADAPPGTPDGSPTDAPPGTADATAVCGATTVTGTFEGVAFDPIQRAYFFAPPGSQPPEIIARESAGAACAMGPATERFFRIGFACPPLEARTYPIDPGFGPELCGPEGPIAIALVQENGGFVLGIAEAGEVVVDAVTPSCVSGTFTTTFPSGDTLTGTFGAVVCPEP